MIFGGRLDGEAEVSDWPTQAMPARDEAGPRYETKKFRMTVAPTCHDA